MKRKKLCGFTVRIAGVDCTCKLAPGHYEKRNKLHVAQVWLRVKNSDGKLVIIRTIRFMGGD